MATGAKAQTVIQPCTPISTVSSLPFGTYSFISGKDSVSINIVSAVPVCPICKVYTAADTLAIQNLKVCPIPPPVKQRTAVGIMWDIILNKKTILYDDGSSSTL